MTESPVTWPRRMRREQASDYLREEHNIDLDSKTLNNRNARGLGPKPEYLGTLPYYRREVLDAWAETAFTPESPVAVTRRKAKAAELAAAPTQSRNTKRRTSRTAAVA